MTLPDRARWRQLAPLLDELLELDQHSQDKRLGELRAGDEALADELASLLTAAARAEASNFLSVDDSSPDELTLALIGKQIGAYVI